MQASKISDHSSSLRRLLPEAVFHGAGDIRVSSCSCDADQLQPGDLFADLSGNPQDGRELAAVAVRSGCSAILTEHALPEIGVPVCAVPSARDAYGRICHDLAGNPSRSVRVVGVAGTNAKTTTSCLIARILNLGGYKAGILGALGYCDGEHFEPAKLRTPPPERLAKWLRRMADNDCSHAVMEISSRGLQQARLAGMQLDSLCVTNVRREQLAYQYAFGEHGDYRPAKSEAFAYLSAKGFAIINADDPTAAGYLHSIDGPVLTIGIRSQAEISGTIIERHVSEQTFLLTAGSDTLPVRTRMIGTHHVYNCLCAAAVGLTYGIALPTVVRALESVEEVPGRLQRIECGQPFSVFVDCARTLDSLHSSLSALREVVAGRLLCVFSAGCGEDKWKRPLAARAIETLAQRIIITSDNCDEENSKEIIGDVLDGFEDLTKIEVISDRAAAIARALSAAGPGDCVIIAGKAPADVQISDVGQSPPDDGEIAREWLYKNQTAEA